MVAVKSTKPQDRTLIELVSRVICAVQLGYFESCQRKWNGSVLTRASPIDASHRSVMMRNSPNRWITSWKIKRYSNPSHLSRHLQHPAPQHVWSTNCSWSFPLHSCWPRPCFLNHNWPFASVLRYITFQISFLNKQEIRCHFLTESSSSADMYVIDPPIADDKRLLY